MGWFTTPTPRTSAEWTASGACTSGSTARPRGATRRGSGGAAMMSTTASDRHDEHEGNPTKKGRDEGVGGSNPAVPTQTASPSGSPFQFIPPSRTKTHPNYVRGLGERRRHEVLILESPSGDVVHCGVTASPSILKTHGNTRSHVRSARRRTHSEALGGATAERPQLRERPDLPLASSDRQVRFRRSLPRDDTHVRCVPIDRMRHYH